MHKKTGKILITEESHEIIIVKRRGKDTLNGYCAHCKANTELLTLDSAVTLSALRTKEILALIDSKSIHATEIQSGHLLICANSLGNAKEPENV